METSSPLVTADWLKTHIDAPDVKVCETTWHPPWVPRSTNALTDYNDGHIPGAAFLDLEAFSDPGSDLPNTLPSAEQFSSRARKAGLGDGHRIILYDRNAFVASARFWWMFRVMGHSEVYVLDGGFEAWQSIGEIEDLPPPAPSERHFTVRKRGDLLRSREQVSASLDADGYALLDARAPARFSGSGPEPRPELPSGHIPGSTNVPSSGVASASGFLKSDAELRALFGDALDASQITTSCGSGVTAAVLALALAQIGRDDVAVYDGSWTEWASNPDLPRTTSS